jgi:hypothetical protein
MAFGGAVGNLFTASAQNMPTFKGRNCTDFTRNWETWLQNISRLHQGTLSEEVKLRLFESAADDGVRYEIQRKRERGETVKYQDIYSWFTRKYGGDTENEAVTDLKSLRLQYEGKLTNVEFIPFSQHFQLVYERQDTIPLAEAARLFLAQVPDNIRRRVLTEQARQTERQPRVRLAGMFGIRMEDVTQFVTQTLARKGCSTEISVVPKGEQYVVGVADKAAMDALLNCNGRTVETPQGTMSPRFTLVEAAMELKEISDVVERELRTQDKSSQIAKVSTIWQENAKVRAVDRKPAAPAPVAEAPPPAAKPSTPAAAQRPATPTRRDGGYRRNDHNEGNWWSDWPRTGGGYQGNTWWDGNERGRAKGDGGKGNGKGKGGNGKGKGKGKGDRSSSRDRQATTEQNGRGTSRRRSGTPSEEQRCRNCDSPLHWERDCPMPSTRPRTPTRSAAGSGGQTTAANDQKE